VHDNTGSTGRFACDSAPQSQTVGWPSLSYRVTVSASIDLKGEVEMSKTEKYYRIEAYEWLQPTGDACKLLVRYSRADDNQGVQNRKDSSIVVKLSRNVIIGAQLEDDADKAKVIIDFLKGKIEGSIRNGNDLRSEMTITSYDSDFSTNPQNIVLSLGEWHSVIIERKIGFLSS
jgi:hypothetical protein